MRYQIFGVSIITVVATIGAVAFMNRNRALRDILHTDNRLGDGV